jgi:formylglycine-generating enzyme required for sulfatase activity
MAEIFISYKSERRKAAEHLAAVLAHYGYSVWFDYQLIKGSDFGLQIDRRIREAKALVVLWCSKSVASRWVIEEVDLAHNLGILIPVKIEECELPVGFRRQDYIDMSPWDGAPRSHQLDPLLKALAQRIGRPPHLDLNALWGYEDTWRRFGAPSLKSFALGKPLAPVEGDRGMPQAETASNPVVAPVPVAPWISPAPAAVEYRHALMALAAQEWPAVRDSADPRRLERFERGFPGTFYADEARALREKIEAEARRQRDAEAKRQAEEQKFREEGRIPVLVGDREHNKTLWILPGSGEPFRDLDGGPEMVVVRAGSFMMGSPETEPGRFENEGPRHKVTIARPFAVGRYAVTRGQFTAFVKAMGHKAEGADKWTEGEWKDDPKASWRDPGFPQDDSHPVTCVNWGDAKAYVSWLAEVTGKPYRLLTEAEWEYAARADTTTPFWWGSSITPAQANYDGNYVYKGGGSKGQYRKGTVPAGDFAANPWGLYNVHGNVWEWCEDVWHDSYNGARTDASAWLQDGNSSSRVVRGGAWVIDPGALRSALRYGDHSGGRFDLLGFRLGRTLTS